MAFEDEVFGLPSIADFMEVVASYDDEVIDGLRCEFEDCEQGRKVVATNLNRRLCDILKPNSRENLERIRQFLYSLTVGQLQEVLLVVPTELREQYPQG